jgi:phosphomannomutase
MPQLLFSISGLRGIVGETITPQIIQYYSYLFGQFISGKQIGIGRDNRLSSAALWRDVYTAFLKSGYTIYDLGISPTPMTVKMVSELKLDGGVQITASHNPESWNGLKFILPQGRFFYPDEFNDFKKFLARHKFSAWPIYLIDEKTEELLAKNFILVNQELVDKYLETVINTQYFQAPSAKKLRVGLDSNNGSTEFVMRRLISKLKGEVYSLSGQTYGFYRSPEPQPQNLKKLSELVRKEKLDLGIAFDPDGDRVAFVDEKGRPFSEEETILLALLYILPNWPGPVVVNNATTSGVDELCQKFGSSVYRTRIGEAYVVKKIEEVNARVGGEGNGGLVLPEINKTRDGILASSIVISLLASYGKPFSKLHAMLPKYFRIKTVLSSYRKDWYNILKKSFSRTPKISFDQLDGLKIMSPEYWILVRKSNTEPVLRIIVESKSENFTRKLISKTIDLLKS